MWHKNIFAAQCPNSVTHFATKANNQESFTGYLKGRTYFRPLVHRLKTVKKGMKPLLHPKYNLYY